MILDALQIIGGTWTASSVIVLALLIADHAAGEGAEPWFWAVAIALGPVALLFELYTTFADRN